jgi:hypothetical protein
MPTNVEFIATIHEISIVTDEMCAGIERIISKNNADTIEVPVDILLNMCSLLRSQNNITNKLVEENAMIVDQVESIVHSLKQ